MITEKEFEVIRLILKTEPASVSPQEIFEASLAKVFSSEREVAALLTSLTEKAYLQNGFLTEEARNEIKSLRVDSAIILAAGGSDISAKSVYSMPKGLYVKNGETLIERQIRQLQEAGIRDITVVIGYKQEMYFFLEEKWGVTLEVNPEFQKNNIGSLYAARAHLGNTYICNCDNYFEENPFSTYEYESYHATVYKADAQNELLVRKNSFGRILQVYSGAKQGECIYGHAYLNRSFSQRLISFMEEEISDFRVSALFWEEFVSRHIEDLDLYAREYPAQLLMEFDSIQEIQNIDSLFLESVSGRINEKICQILHCREEDISNIVILQKGLTNILFTFSVRGETYIFRYPGDSSSFFIYRKNEVRAQQLAAACGVDKTYVYIEESGIKISKYRSHIHNLNEIYYKDVELMKRLARKIRQFHEAGQHMEDWEEYRYDPMQQAERLMLEASKMKANLFDVFRTEWSGMRELYQYTERDGVEKTMCHNDINQDNCLLTDQTFDVIDWEFAGWNDPAYDFGRVIAGYEFDDPAIDQILEAYFGRPATPLERLHWIAYIAIHCWYYVGWATYKESINESSRDWMLFFFKQVKRVLKYALPRYRELYHEEG